MPTDGTLLLEHMPKSKQYLVTALSVFFSFGAVLAAVVGLLVIPNHSCLPTGPCDPDIQIPGWRCLLTALGLIVSPKKFLASRFYHADATQDLRHVPRTHGLFPSSRIS